MCSKLPLCCSRNTKSQKDKENCSINHNKLQDIHFPSLPHFSKNKLVRAHWNVKYRHYFIVLRAPHLFPSSFSSYKHGYKLKKKKKYVSHCCITNYQVCNDLNVLPSSSAGRSPEISWLHSCSGSLKPESRCQPDPVLLCSFWRVFFQTLLMLFAEFSSLCLYN